jgi:hypothetical protein
VHLGKTHRHPLSPSDQLPLSGWVITLLELAGCAAVLACAGKGVGVGVGFVSVAFGSGGGMYSGPLLPQPAIAAKARQAGSSRIDRRMVQSPEGTRAV